MKRLTPWLELVLFELVAIAIGATFRYPLVTDDPFITYRYARNLLTGQGFVYNIGEHILSTTTPLYTLILATLGLVLPDLPVVGFWASVLCFGVAGCALYVIASDAGRRGTGLVAGLFLLVSPGLVLTFGLETGLYLALALAALYMYLHGRFTAAFALLGLLTLTRNDGILFAAVLLVHLLWTRARGGPRSVREIVRLLRAHSRPILALLAVLLPWFGFAWWWFGSPFPFTLTAKIAQADSGLWDPFDIGFLKWSGEWVQINWLAAIFSLAGAMIMAIATIRRRAREGGDSTPLLQDNSIGSCVKILVCWAIAHVLAFSILGVAFYAWYVAPVLPALGLLAGIGIDSSASWLAKRVPLRMTHIFTIGVAVAALMLMEVRADVAAGMQQPSPKVQVYRRAADWIAQNTPASASVDALEVGVIGYYDQRRTVDFVGLVDPSRVPYLRQRALADGVRHSSADFVIAIPPDTWLPIDPWFDAEYTRIQEFGAPGFYGGQPLVIYRRADAGLKALEVRAVNLSFDKRVLLESVEIYSRVVSPGGLLPVLLHLRASATLSNNAKFTLQLVGTENRVAAQTDTYYPQRLPENGEPFLDHQALRIPLNAPPGKYNMILALYDLSSGDRANLYDADGNEGSDFVSLGDIEIR